MVDTHVAPVTDPVPPPPVVRRVPVWLLTTRFWSWAGPLIVTVLGGLLRFWHLERPGKLVFDETYYVKAAAAMLKVGYELGLRPDLAKDPNKLNAAADKLWDAGNHDVFSSQPDYVVHPPLGKWMIAAGEWLIGQDNPFSWRFTAAVCGTLSLLMVGRIAYRLFGSALIATIAALLLAVDGQHLVMSRTGLLDIFVMFWALAAFQLLLIDRDVARRRLERWAAGLPEGTRPRVGPWLGVRWARIAAVICLGLCTGVKWSGVYFAAVFMLMSVMSDAGLRRRVGIRWWLPGAALADGVQAFVTTVVLLPATYLACWTGWFVTSGGYDRHWAESNPATGLARYVPDALRSLWEYHKQAYSFHVGLDSPHPYQSNPWSWIVQGRPTSFFYDSHTLGHAGCHVEKCVQPVNALGNPLIWWAATVGIAVLLFRWVLARDNRAGFVLAGLAGGYLPWFMYQHRTIFTFYTVAFVPWIALTVAYCAGLMIGRPGDSVARRYYPTMAVAVYLVLVVTVSWYFYPIWTARIMPQPAWNDRMWLPSWI